MAKMIPVVLPRHLADQLRNRIAKDGLDATSTLCGVERNTLARAACFCPVSPATVTRIGAAFTAEAAQ
jgi:hypothetical protein